MVSSPTSENAAQHWMPNHLSSWAKSPRFSLFCSCGVKRRANPLVQTRPEAICSDLYCACVLGRLQRDRAGGGGGGGGGGQIGNVVLKSESVLHTQINGWSLHGRHWGNSPSQEIAKNDEPWFRLNQCFPPELSLAWVMCEQCALPERAAFASHLLVLPWHHCSSLVSGFCFLLTLGPSPGLLRFTYKKPASRYFLVCFFLWICVELLCIALSWRMIQKVSCHVLASRRTESLLVHGLARWTVSSFSLLNRLINPTNT